MDLCWSCSQTHPYPLWDWAIVEHSWTESRPPDRPQNSQVNLKGGFVWWESSRPRSGSKREHCFFLSHGMYLFLFMPVLSHREFESAHTKYLFLHKIKISERKLREIWKGGNRKPEQCNLKKKKPSRFDCAFCLFVFEIKMNEMIKRGLSFPDAETSEKFPFWALTNWKLRIPSLRRG